MHDKMKEIGTGIMDIQLNYQNQLIIPGLEISQSKQNLSSRQIQENKIKKNK